MYIRRFLINNFHFLKFKFFLEKVKGSFHGNYSENVLEGDASLEITNLGEIYKIEFPKSYVKGIFFGKAGIENTGSLKIICEKTKLISEIKFEYGNSVKGIIKNEKEEIIYKIIGSMKSEVVFLDVKNDEKILIGKPKKILKFVEPVEKQKSNESRRLWYFVTEAIINGDNEIALKEKMKIEQIQRDFLLKNEPKPMWFKKTDKIVKNVPIYEFDK